MMDWIETADGYVRKDAIIDVHISRYCPGAIYMSLINGDSVKYKDYGSDDESAKTALSELMNYLTGNEFHIRRFV